ncbi:hypothetical protein NPIL_260191 [Nephila pilipes]|uniref:Uncharacterized protein n=1 Tax=Nephila pilipes TaxID=299642 RepID=A0A8X6JYI6_NEPPI|nr:hypothetical protein NPIL_260191 [Nephila pilipes]
MGRGWRCAGSGLWGWWLATLVLLAGLLRHHHCHSPGSRNFLFSENMASAAKCCTGISLSTFLTCIPGYVIGLFRIGRAIRPSRGWAVGKVQLIRQVSKGIAANIALILSIASGLSPFTGVLMFSFAGVYFSLE